AVVPEVRYGTVMSVRAPVLCMPAVRVIDVRSAFAVPAVTRSRPAASRPATQRNRLMIVLLYVDGVSGIGTTVELLLLYPPECASVAGDGKIIGIFWLRGAERIG